MQSCEIFSLLLCFSVLQKMICIQNCFIMHHNPCLNGHHSFMMLMLYHQRHIQSPVKHLQWSVWWKHWTVFSSTHGVLNTLYWVGNAPSYAPSQISDTVLSKSLTTPKKMGNGCFSVNTIIKYFFSQDYCSSFYFLFY